MFDRTDRSLHADAIDKAWTEGSGAGDRDDGARRFPGAADGQHSTIYEFKSSRYRSQRCAFDDWVNRARRPDLSLFPMGTPHSRFRLSRARLAAARSDLVWPTQSR